MGELVARIGPCPLAPSGDPYRSLVRSVIHQQLAGAAAGAIAGRLKARHRGRLPSPSALLAESDADLRAVGLSRQKSATLREIASAFDSGRLTNRSLYRMSDAAVVESVTRLRGIGEWTAHMLLLSSLGRPDILPVGDFGIRKGAMRLFALDELPKPAELERLAEPWRPHRSVASWYLWRRADEAE
jgi:DNA-3-methyladenine glycosylase II